MEAAVEAGASRSELQTLVAAVEDLIGQPPLNGDAESGSTRHARPVAVALRRSSHFLSSPSGALRSHVWVSLVS